MSMSLVQFHRCAALLLAMVMLGLTMSGRPAHADDFRVDTEVYGDQGKEPTARTLTLFHRGAIYDFPATGNEVTIFAPKTARVVLLDTKRRVRTELTVDQLYDFSVRLRDWAGKQEDGLLKFTGAPKFDHQIDKDSGRVSFSSRWMTYEIRTRPATSEEMATQYRRFCDVYAHLNTLLNPGSLPPFGRLEVNRLLAQSGSLPTEIQLTFPPARRFGDRELKLETRHRFRETLSDSDLAKVEKAGQQNANYRVVSLAEFRGVKAKVAKR